MKELRDKVAIVTGASRGLGPYVARALAAEGMRLVVAARSADQLDGVAARLRENGAEAIAVATDVTDSEALERMLATANESFGPADLLVNNAGTVTLCPFGQIGITDIERVVRLNLVSAMILTRLVLPGMLERRRGHVVNMSSLAGIFGPPYDAVYGATKAALVGFTESLRDECRASGVSASVICPSFVEEAGIYHEGRKYRVGKASRIVGTTTPDAVARAVLRAVRHDIPQINVNSMPIRPMAAVARLSPGLARWALRKVDAWRPFRQGAEANLRMGGKLTGLTESPG
ncbi:MAG: SDR family NAD(P)-dependent oxidoreductase [Gemmatimonadetes bacterium]|nr:SDR family NAD(P)-dependent oxidoreductase [Gemmatimonadota bacterium]NIT69236.1 SDR family NAD(P)-dependent oxidoreductase [Gemmatimonadota bacterium]NIW38640.1 SDR family NAD(P)-dependent oxidoreductase [Gemmatimonadota bacterium]NIW77850.1 SDR family NAD(P)-dependent oxidoreductase [Gemmatimonadota bacterium]NIY37813.1 SDR family NAD(P)-dependent oxidoreductase [Gemmatimonadota bacterium]